MRSYSYLYLLCLIVSDLDIVKLNEIQDAFPPTLPSSTQSPESSDTDHRVLKHSIRRFKNRLSSPVSVKENYNSLRIFNGDPADLGHIPFIVRINIYTNNYRYLCGGSIISEHWVVTAAHCVVDKAQYNGSNNTLTIHGPRIRVTAGDASTLEYEYSQIVKEVTQVYIHENYHEWYLQSDIALLYIEDGFDFDRSNIGKVNLGTQRPGPGSTVTVAGWGTTETLEVATTLQQTTYTVPNQTTCVQNYNQNGYHVFPGMWCTGDDVMTSHSATGDSGGPVFVQHGEGNFTLYGVVSWGAGIENIGPYDYDVNTDVVYYRRWIRNILKSYRQYRIELHAKMKRKLISWRSGTDVLRYQVYNISCERDKFVRVIFTKLELSKSDFSHVIVRDGNQYNSPVLLQRHEKLSESISATSTSNKLLILIRTTVSYYVDKKVQFSYYSVANKGKLSDTGQCGDNLKLCSNRWECYDPTYECDGEVADCSDWSDEDPCNHIDSMTGSRSSKTVSSSVLVGTGVWITIYY